MRSTTPRLEHWQQYLPCNSLKEISIFVAKGAVNIEGDVATRDVIPHNRNFSGNYDSRQTVGKWHFRINIRGRIVFRSWQNKLPHSLQLVKDTWATVHTKEVILSCVFVCLSVSCKCDVDIIENSGKTFSIYVMDILIPVEHPASVYSKFLSVEFD